MLPQEIVVSNGVLCCILDAIQDISHFFVCFMHLSILYCTYISMKYQYIVNTNIYWLSTSISKNLATLLTHLTTHSTSWCVQFNRVNNSAINVV